MINYNNVIENDFEKALYVRKRIEVMNYLKQFGAKDFWSIIKNVGGSERRMLRLLNEMVLEKDIKFNKVESLYYFSDSNVQENFDCMCSNCKGDRVIINNLKHIENILSNVWKNKPTPTFCFDQRPVNLKTTLKRVAYLLSNGDLKNKRIVLLGDDDLTGIAIALLNLSEEVVSLDVDERLVNYINQVAKQYNLNLKGIAFNATDSVPKNLKHKFDVLLTDPTPEKVPFTIFINASIDLLKEENSILYTSIYSSAMQKTLELQRVLTNSNLYITDIIPKFTEYQSIYSLFSENDIKLMKTYNIKYSEDSICFTESFFRMEITSETCKQSIKYKGSDLFGKATKRVIKNINNDAVHIEEEENYINTVLGKIKETSDRIFYSGD